MAVEPVTATSIAGSHPIAGTSADLALAWLDQWRGTHAVDVQSLAHALLSAGPDMPAIASVEAMLTPVERGELAAAMDAAVDRRGVANDRADPPREGSGLAAVTRITTTDQHAVVRGAEVMLEPLDRFRSPPPTIDDGATVTDAIQPGAPDNIAAEPLDAAKAIEILPPLPPGAALPPPVTSRSD